MVKVSFLENEDKLYKFLVDDVDVNLLNFFRRISNYNIPIYAIDEVDFIENDSVIVDEMISNRIGLCPVFTPLQNTGKKVTFSLEKKGPCTVYSKDLVSNDSEIKMVYDDIPITKLADNQNLKFEAYAILGKGTTHFKFSSAIVFYKQLVDLETLRGCDGCGVCVNSCPKNNIKLVSGKPKIIDLYKCDACRACADECPKSLLKLVYSRNYILNIELIGQNSVKDLIIETKRYTKEYFMVLKKKFK
jgi:DNA-directed RNA polymerase subunit D